MTKRETPMPAAGRGPAPVKLLIARLRGSDTGYAAILAGAMIATNLVALITTVAFGRLLGVQGYGQLAAILSTFIILSVPGAALQVATAREGALGHLGEGRQFATTLRSWTIRLILVTVGVTVVSVLLRHQIRALIIPKAGDGLDWAGAFVPPAACIWILLSVQRGALQAIRSYPTVGLSMIAEQIARLVLGVGLALGLVELVKVVTESVSGNETDALRVVGAYLGTPLAMGVTALILGFLLAARLGKHEASRTAHSLRTLAAEGWVAILGLALIAVLQNVDVILAQHRLPDKAAGAYAAAAVAAKVVVWVAIGIGFYLLPEAARRHAAGQDARPVLFKALAMTGAVAAPCIIVYAVFPKLLLQLAFGEEYANLGASALLELGIAMSFLAVCYLAVQLLLALRQIRFLWILAAVAVAEVLALLFMPGGNTVNGFATIVLVVQIVAALGSGLAAYFASAAPADGGFAPDDGSSTAQTPNLAASE